MVVPRRICSASQVTGVSTSKGLCIRVYYKSKLLFLGVCNEFLWRSFCLEAFASFYAYGPLASKPILAFPRPMGQENMKSKGGIKHRGSRGRPHECWIFAPATIAPMINANVKRNSNPNPNPTLNPYPLHQKTIITLTLNSLLSEISLQEQLSPEQMSDHQPHI